MPSRVQICNMALGMIGAEPITSLSLLDSEPVRKCNLYLDQAIEEVLRLYPWNCASRLVALAQLTETPAFKFGYCYSLPADCLRALYPESSDITFKVYGSKLYTDESTFNLEYIAAIGVNEMDSLCRGAVIAKLAAYLAFAISNSASLQEQMEKLYEKALLKAAIADTQEGTPDVVDVDDFLLSRY